MNGTSLRLAAALAALLPLAAPAAEKGAEKPAPTPTTAAKLPPIYDTTTIAQKEIDWKKKACERSNRRLFINFGTNDCALCRVVNDAMNDPKFYGPFNRQFIPAWVDVSAGSRNLPLLKEYGVDAAKGLPAIVILDEEGNFAEATRSGEMARAAEKGIDAVQVWISSRFHPDEK